MKQWILVFGLICAGCDRSPGTCEVDDGTGGTLCYEMGPESADGYFSSDCDGIQGVWTEGATCADRGHANLCVDDDASLIYGDTVETCCGFNTLDVETAGDDGCVRTP